MEAAVTLFFSIIEMFYLLAIWKLQWLCSTVSSRCSTSRWFRRCTDFILQYHHGVLPLGDLEAAVTLFYSVNTMFCLSVIWKLQWLFSSVSSRCSTSRSFGRYSVLVFQCHHGVVPISLSEAPRSWCCTYFLIYRCHWVITVSSQYNVTVKTQSSACLPILQ